MDTKKDCQAIDTAIEIIKDYRRKHHAFDANLYKRGLHTFRTEKAYKGYEQLSGVIERLEKIKEQLSQ